MNNQRHQVKVGNVLVGGQDVVVQSMTNTDTADAKATAQQIYQLHQAGSQLVRITVNNEESAAAVPEIIDRLRAARCEVPVIGDFHYNGHRLLQDYPECAEKLPNTASTQAMWVLARKRTNNLNPSFKWPRIWANQCELVATGAHWIRN